MRQGSVRTTAPGVLGVMSGGTHKMNLRKKAFKSTKCKANINTLYAINCLIMGKLSQRTLVHDSGVNCNSNRCALPVMVGMVYKPDPVVSKCLRDDRGHGMTFVNIRMQAGIGTRGGYDHVL
jgi:hypothetical protein